MSGCLLVGLGAFAGGITRYLLARQIGAMAETRFPLGTFVINVSGSLLLGLLGGFLAQRPSPHADALRLALGVGFCGGFTTFSTFALETDLLLATGAWLWAVANMAFSLVAGLFAVRLGALAARSWF